MHDKKKKYFKNIIKDTVENIELALMREFECIAYLRPKQNVSILTYYRNLEFEIARLVAGWIPTVSQLELKTDLARQAYLIMQIVDILDSRLKELPCYKQPISKNDQLKYIREVLGKAYNQEEFLIGIYNVVQEKLVECIKKHLKKCDSIADLPTIDRLENVLSLIKKQIKWSSRWTTSYIEENGEAVKTRVNYISKMFNCFDGTPNVTGDMLDSPYEKHLMQSACAEPARLDGEYNLVEKFMYSLPRETQGNITDILYHNFSELFVPDLLSYMIYDINNMPYEFYKDFIKHLWDESRHANIGIRELSNLGISIKNLPLNRVKREKNYVFLLALIGYVVEGCSFSRKLLARDAFFKLKLYSCAVATEYDIADESRHIKYIEKWLPLLHQKENHKKHLKEIIEEAQQYYLDLWESAEDNTEARSMKAENLSVNLGKFGTFCKKIEFDIDFNSFPLGYIKSRKLD